MRRTCLLLGLTVGLALAASACDRASPGTPDGAVGADGPGVQSDAADPAAPLVVVTINLRCMIDDWDARLPLLADGLAAAGADVIGFQEVCSQPGGRDALEELSAALEARGAGELAQARTTTHRAWDAYDEGIALFSRYPIAAVHIEALPPGAFPRKMIAARILAPAGPVTFAVTHLDNQGADVRAAQAAAVADALDAFAGATPAVLVGDLNETPGGAVTAALTGAGLTDAWNALHPADGGFTFPSSGPDARIDYVWTRGDAVRPATMERILTTPGGATYPSDHVGVRAVLAPAAPGT